MTNKKSTTKKSDQVLMSCEQDEHANQVIERVIALQKETDWDLPVSRGKALDGKALDAWLAKKEDAAAVNLVERGLGYALKKRELGHGAFQAWIKDTGRSPRSVRESIQVAHMLVELSDSKRRRAAALPYRKLNVLASAPPELADELLESPTDIEKASRDDLRELVNLKKRYAKLEKTCTDLQNDALHKQMQSYTKDNTQPVYPASIQRMRMESTLVSDKAIACIQDLATELDALSQATDLSKSVARRKEELRGGVAPAYANLLAVAAELHELIRTVENSFEDNLRVQRAEDMVLLSSKECEAAAKHRAAMVNELVADKAVRNTARAGHKPRRSTKKKTATKRRAS